MNHKIKINISYNGEKGISISMGTSDGEPPTPEEILNMTSVLLTILTNQGLITKEEIITTISENLERNAKVINLENPGTINAKQAFVAIVNKLG